MHSIERHKNLRCPSRFFQSQSVECACDFAIVEKDMHASGNRTCNRSRLVGGHSSLLCMRFISPC